ncbi:MAG TPA: hypothetical protein VJT33_10575, partial [bacterium]|nr:hypothetical protein [bacterium]
MASPRTENPVQHWSSGSTGSPRCENVGTGWGQPPGDTNKALEMPPRRQTPGTGAGISLLWREHRRMLAAWVRHLLR